MDRYRKTPSDEFEALKRGEMSQGEYLEQTHDELVEVLNEDVKAKREREQTNAHVEYLLSDDL